MERDDAGKRAISEKAGMITQGSARSLDAGPGGSPAKCACGADVYNGHHCGNGHMLVRD